MSKIARYLIISGGMVAALAGLAFAGLVGACAADTGFWGPMAVLLAIGLATTFIVGACLALAGVIITAVQRWNDAFAEGVIRTIDATVGRLADALPRRDNVRTIHSPHDRSRP